VTGADQRSAPVNRVNRVGELYVSAGDPLLLDPGPGLSEVGRGRWRGRFRFDIRVQDASRPRSLLLRRVGADQIRSLAIERWPTRVG